MGQMKKVEKREGKKERKFTYYVENEQEKDAKFDSQTRKELCHLRRVR